MFVIVRKSIKTLRWTISALMCYAAGRQPLKYVDRTQLDTRAVGRWQGVFIADG